MQLIEHVSFDCEGAGPDGASYAFHAGYFSLLATISNVWRGTSVHGKLVELDGSLFGDLAADLFNELPPRCLRGRWGSVGDVEETILTVMQYATTVFTFCEQF